MASSVMSVVHVIHWPHLQLQFYRRRFDRVRWSISFLGWRQFLRDVMLVLFGRHRYVIKINLVWIHLIKQTIHEYTKYYSPHSASFPLIVGFSNVSLNSSVRAADIIIFIKKYDKINKKIMDLQVKWWFVIVMIIQGSGSGGYLTFDM